MANPKIETFVDPLHATTQDTTKWDASANYGNLAFTTGGAVLSNPANYTGGGGLQSTGIYDLTASNAVVRIVDAGNQALPSWRARFELRTAANPLFAVGWAILQGTAYPYFLNGSSSPNWGTAATYNPAVHKFFRIRESGGAIYWDWSTDGKTWTQQWGYGVSIDPTAMKVAIYADTSSNEASATSATFDDVGGPPPNPKIETLVDPMHSTAQDTTKWDPAQNTGNPSFTTGGVVLPNLDSGATAGYSLIASLGVFTLIGSQAMVRVDDTRNAGMGNWRVEFRLAQASDPTTGVEWLFTSGLVYPYYVVGGGFTNVGAASPYDPRTGPVFYRIRESAGKVYWEAGLDGVTWPYSVSTADPAGVDLTALRARLSAGMTSGSGGGYNQAIFDDFGGVPPPPVVAVDAGPAQATGDAPAPTFTSVPTATSIDVLAAGAAASAPAPSITESKAIDVAPASASAGATASSLLIDSGVPQANGTGAAPAPVVGTLGRVDLDVGTARSTATTGVWTISASTNAQTAPGTSEAWSWAQARSADATAAFATAVAPAPSVATFHALDVNAADALAQAWPVTVTTDRVNVVGPPIAAGVLATARTGVIASASPGVVARGSPGRT